MTSFDKVKLFTSIWLSVTLTVVWPVAKILLVLSTLSVMLFLILYYGGIFMAMAACIVGLVFTISYDEAIRNYKHAVEREQNKIRKP